MLSRFTLTNVVQNLDLLEPHNLIPNGVWSFDALLKYGEEHKQCPYFTARRMVSMAFLFYERIASDIE